ncbi:sporulation protein YpjB [Paenibacillus oenotherae]|uniref:Sporulation protein YpjB n=1 Tax=Paenibacillus oenotherae TaxID=1435645 RepID=A0ABS7D0M0_9BACL|nr:sporulation protein YpjB [Paenibacillus oenotherae]MBW7473418.1 sporulation protein YpjB [Paenibacillus oenotherae]
MSKSSSCTIVSLVIFLIVLTGCGNMEERESAAMRSAAAVVTADKPPAAALNQLSGLSEQLYAAAQEGNRQLAYTYANRLQQTSVQKVLRKLGTVEGWREFDHSVAKLKRTLEHKGAGMNGYMDAARLKLAVDALYRPEAPLWMQYDRLLREDWTRMRQAWKSSSSSRIGAAGASLSVYRMRVERLEIAALMGQRDEQVRELQAHVRHMGQLLEAADDGAAGLEPARIDAVFSALEESVNALFDHAIDADSKVQAAIPVPPVSSNGERLTLLFIAAFVLLILGYTVWRKYAYELEHGSPAPGKGNHTAGRK